MSLAQNCREEVHHLKDIHLSREEDHHPKDIHLSREEVHHPKDIHLSKEEVHHLRDILPNKEEVHHQKGSLLKDKEVAGLTVVGDLHMTVGKIVQVGVLIQEGLLNQNMEEEGQLEKETVQKEDPRMQAITQIETAQEEAIVAIQILAAGKEHHIVEEDHLIPGHHQGMIFMEDLLLIHPINTVAMAKKIESPRKSQDQPVLLQRS